MDAMFWLCFIGLLMPMCVGVMYEISMNGDVEEPTLSLLFTDILLTVHPIILSSFTVLFLLCWSKPI